ncbi:NAD-dependent epimerase/dehydratase family protein [Aureibaculum sp. 2210JD6-5]|uniref:polysaccharide biosynthesis C-terminal domain-containing protein n=1 Tax=Aureibaculum sp. 2210JD6-5 TaxID=3103957 RepID=UPI002AADD4D2|nr:NAD-dependent epimerase/dehydratase family protein [Aureibaculum sp. 2210JD6-5]MDY7394095.1 NAD-dependent epimerase/dehydratase family protein [Aureibaculum sp. 2210JD6-5]
MIKVGITGQSGFMGSHLYNYLSLKDEIELIMFKKIFFKDASLLQEFVKQCDVIVHIAAMNRHDDPQVIYNTNINLVKKLTIACDREGVAPKIVFSSSIQEDRDNLYGKSKKDSKIFLEQWAKKHNTSITTLIIPNVFGPFGKPYYNSVVSTFCYQVVHNEIPKIVIDGQLSLIYINELSEIFYKDIIKTEKQVISYRVKHTSSKKVTEILALINAFKSDYFDNGVVPDLRDPFEINLFNTFRSFIPTDYFPKKYTRHTDERGSFVEIIRAKTSGQSSYSTTKPGITRGNHYHTRKVERFAVISGKALIQLRKINSDEVINYYLDGSEPAYVDMPIWFTHNIKNIGDSELITLFWINEPYDESDPDTYFKKV